jgi:hypothetical protein
MTDSKNGSKTNLNESNMPLLDDDHAEKSGETPEKEQIELTETEKDDSGNEKGKGDKKKKEKKPKKEKGPRGPNCIDTLSAGLDLAHRDANAINTEIDLGFDDVLAEPASTQGFDAIWKISFILFTHSRLWLYKIISAFVAFPAALFWGFVFSVITVFYVWLIAPALRIFDLGVSIIRRLWVGVMRCTLEPICSAAGAVFSNMNVSQKRHMVAQA